VPPPKQLEIVRLYRLLGPFTLRAVRYPDDMPERSVKLLDLGLPVVSMQDAKPGDPAFCHSHGILGLSIRIAERIETGKPFCYYNHIAILTAPIRDDAGVIVDWWVVQAEAKGVERSKLSTVAPGGNYEICSLTAFPTIMPGANSKINRELVVYTAQALVGLEYGKLTIACEVVSILVPWLHIDFRGRGTFICSAAFAYALLAGGGALPLDDLYMITPAQIVQLAYQLKIERDALERRQEVIDRLAAQAQPIKIARPPLHA
jgi:hypothetical protein